MAARRPRTRSGLASQSCGIDPDPFHSTQARPQLSDRPQGRLSRVNPPPCSSNEESSSSHRRPIYSNDMRQTFVSPSIDWGAESVHFRSKGIRGESELGAPSPGTHHGVSLSEFLCLPSGAIKMDLPIAADG